MKILFVTNQYPTINNPDYGIFTKEQIEDVLNKEVEGEIFFINAREKGINEYFKAFMYVKNNYKRFDLIHCFHGLSLIIAFFATSKKKILVSFLNSVENESLLSNLFINRIYIFMYKLIIKKNRVFKIFKDKIPINTNLSKRSFYLPNGVDVNFFKDSDRTDSCYKLGLDPKKKYVLFVSSKDLFRAQKRYDIYKKVIYYLKNNYGHYDFEELVLTNQKREKCILYYNSASLSLLTSDYEGSPNSVKESMACNTPIVSTDVGNVSQMISGIANCFVSKSNNPKILGELIIKSINHKKVNLRNELNIRKLTKEQKSQELKNIYKLIING